MVTGFNHEPQGHMVQPCNPEVQPCNPVSLWSQGSTLSLRVTGFNPVTLYPGTGRGWVHSDGIAGAGRAQLNSDSSQPYNPEVQPCAAQSADIRVESWSLGWYLQENCDSSWVDSFKSWNPCQIPEFCIHNSAQIAKSCTSWVSGFWCLDVVFSIKL